MSVVFLDEYGAVYLKAELFACDKIIRSDYFGSKLGYDILFLSKIILCYITVFLRKCLRKKKDSNVMQSRSKTLSILVGASCIVEADKMRGSLVFITN